MTEQHSNLNCRIKFTRIDIDSRMESYNLRRAFSYLLNILCCQYDKYGTEDPTFQTVDKNGETDKCPVVRQPDVSEIAGNGLPDKNDESS